MAAEAPGGAGADAGEGDARAERNGRREFNGPYTGRNLDRVAFPIGGIGAGMFCLEGTGAISHMSVRHRLEAGHEPSCYAAVCVLGGTPGANVARVLEGPMPDRKFLDGGGGGGRTYGLPRFRTAEFLARFPFATIDLADPALPLDVRITGWSPFTPPDPDPSSLPVGALEYTFRNTCGKRLRAVFSFSTRNFMGEGSIGAIRGGFVLYAASGEDRGDKGAFAFFLEGADGVKVDHCWFRGGWFDSFTMAWRNVETGALVENPPVAGASPGATLSAPFELGPGESRTLRLMTCWYVPWTSFRFVGGSARGPAFRKAPSRGTARGQQPVSGFLGRGLVNTYDPEGDGPTGTLVSPEIALSKRYLHFLVGGGAHKGRTCVDLVVDGKVVRSACGKNTEQLEWTTFDVGEFRGRKARIRVVDEESGGWGHILADHFMLSDEPVAALRTGGGNAVTSDPARVALLADFEGDDYGDWKSEHPPDCACGEPGCGDKVGPSTYIPWYATKLKSIEDVADHWRDRYRELRDLSERFRDAFYDTTLPPEVVEAVAANLTILKTSTVLRQHDGRLWCWEGCDCCHGSCAHVWNYAQAICHLFPSLERSLRDAEFHEGLAEDGRQAFRVNLPILPGGLAFDASDGQLGGIMKVYREWRISGDPAWLEEYWPRARLSLDYAIRKYDPRRTGLLEESHHNTYDIEYFGPDGHCGSFYLGALAAAIRMGTAAGDDVSAYRELLEKGRKRMEAELYNGEFFIQIVQKEGLAHNFGPINPRDQSDHYRGVAERVNDEGPKYQYGPGCLSDGVLGLWIARACGIEEDVIDRAKELSHIRSVHRHNLKLDLSAHANPQRPTYAMGDDGGLLLCSWPRGGKPLLPFVYSDEVWTGIEYQVASHLMMLGEVDRGLEIVRAARRRYDGVRRNPFNEYECGHWYARAMSSYGLIQGLAGVRYDAVDRTLHVKPSVAGDFRSFLSTNAGYGVAGVRDGKPFIDVKHGEIRVERKDYVPAPAR